MSLEGVMIERDGAVIIETGILLIFAIIMLIKKVKFKKFALNFAFGFYIAVIIALCFFPIRFTYEGFNLGAAVNLIPVKGTIESISRLIQYDALYDFIPVVGNFVMLMPLGVFYSIYVKNYKLRFLYVFLFSVSIEVMQLLIGLLINSYYRSTDIDDVILNTAGGIIGILLFNLLKKIFLKLKKA